jgi:hypothetical protein
MNLPIDDTKLKTFLALEKRVDALTKSLKAMEEAKNRCLEDYANKKAGAIRAMSPWEAMGPAHVLVMQRTKDYEDLSNALAAATNELQSAKPVLVDEILRAARAAIV